jgi:hypothetical protein
MRFPLSDKELWFPAAGIAQLVDMTLSMDSLIEVWDRPGLGVTSNLDAARPYLPAGEETFFG